MVNELKTRRDCARLLLDWIRPLKSCYSAGCAMLHEGSTAAHYGEKSARMEGFSRVLWGIGPLLATDNMDLSVEEREEITWWNETCLKGLIHGTDPSHEEYWGDVYDYDQKMVEMAAIATMLLLSPDKMWKPLTEEQKNHVREWLNQINRHGVHANNWRFFRILVNVLFTVLDLQPDTDRLCEDLQVIENCYDGDGWYFDGNPSQMDYYIPFAIHYYSLIYAKFMKDTDNIRCRKFLERAERFFGDFVYWFSEDGSSVPFGRSLSYRFAHGAFFAAYAFADEKADYGAVKGMALRNMRYWMKQPIFDKGGILSIGYGYPNLLMSEKYNAPGSPYWGMKVFLMLALPAEHPFWSTEETAVPYKKQISLAHPHMLVTHEGCHAQIYPVGQHSIEHGGCAAKYEKFVYSNQFGFSISRGTTLESGAFDNTLAVSAAGEDFYRMRYGVERFEVTEDYTRSVYHIGKNVGVESLVIPLGTWHVRIHEIDNTESIDVAEGGYAVSNERCFTVVSGRDSGKYTEEMVHQRENALFCCFPWGVSGIVALDKTAGERREPRLVRAFPNTNLLYNLTVIPTLCTKLEPGHHTLISCVYADLKNLPEEEEVPAVRIVTGRNKFGREALPSMETMSAEADGEYRYEIDFNQKHIAIKIAK